jgi:hypothetical protein
MSMDAQGQFDAVYENNNTVSLVLEMDGTDVKLKLKFKQVPGIKQSGTILATKKPGGKYALNFGLGDEEYDEKDLPNPIKKLIDSSGGGPNGNAVKLPPKNEIIRHDYTVRPYAEYASAWNSRRKGGTDPLDKPLPESLYRHVAKLYLDQMGVPLYL